MLCDKKISLVLPVFNEAKNLRPLWDGLLAVLGGTAAEIIFINDGSTDGSWAVLQQLASRDSRIKLLDFSRNFGKEVAISAGLDCASGAAVIVMDADTEHPPAVIPELIKQWQEGLDIVYTIREYSVDTPLVKKITSRFYYYWLNKIAVVRIEPGATDFRLLDKKVVDVFKTFTERERFFRGLIDWLGYRKAAVRFIAPYNPRTARSYSWGKLWRLAMAGLTSFSLFPLKLAGYLGGFITVASGFSLVVMVIVRWFINFGYFSPISFVIVFNILLSGVTLSCLGLIALYVGGIHGEILNRPLYVIRERVNFNQEK